MDLGQGPKTRDLQAFGHAVQLVEPPDDLGIGQLGRVQVLQPGENRSELAHDNHHRPHMDPTLRRATPPVCDTRHVREKFSQIRESFVGP